MGYARTPSAVASGSARRAIGQTGRDEVPSVSTLPVVAADVGGTQMRAALVDAHGGLLMRRSATTPNDADVPSALIELIAEVAAERAHGQASHAVVGLPGAVDYEQGRLLWAPHLPE